MTAVDPDRESQVPESARAESEPDGDADAVRPTIIVDHELERMTEEAALTLENRSDIFQRSGLFGGLVRIVKGKGTKLRGIIRPPGEPQIQPIPLSQLHLMLASSAQWLKYIKVKEELKLVPTTPPDKVVKGLLERGEYPDCIRELQSVVEAPMLRLDHQVIQEPGYDEYSGLLYMQPACLRGHSIPEFPNAEDIEEAKELLLDLFADFPFRSEAHLSAALAALLTCFARFAITGNLPLFLINATTPGTGKTLLSTVISLLAVGREFTKMSQHVDEDAERKMFFSLAMSGTLYVLIDNVDKPLGSGALDMAMTTGSVASTMHYTHQMVSAPFIAMMMATGNNIAFKQGADTARRSLEIALENKLDDPENREDFRHHPLEEYVLKNRAQLVMAALTLLRGYCAAGMPDQKLKNWGGFEGWSRLIRHCLVWCGLPDPYDAHLELRESADTDRQLVEDLVFGFKEVLDYHKTDAITISEVHAEMESDLEFRRHNQHHAMRFPRLYQAILQLCHSRDGKLLSAHVIGMKITKYKGRLSCKHALVPFEKGDRGWRWGVREVSR